MAAPAPVVDTIKEAEAKVAKFSKRVGITSKVLIGLGIVGLFCSILHGSHARGMAQRIISGQKPWGPPPTREEEMAMGTQVITRDELELYDTMKTMSFLMFIMSVMVIGMGKCGLRSVWREKSKVGKRMIKKSAIVFAIVGLTGMMAAQQGKHMHHIAKQYIKHGEEESYKGTTKRFPEDFEEKNRDFAEFFSVTTDACTYADAGSCDAVASCSWCKSAAVKSRCYTVTDAKTLPSSIFQCDKLAEEVETVEEPVEMKQAADYFMNSNDACTYADAGSCDAVASCSWCKSAAVKSRCYTVTDAKTLPSSIFQCDKLSYEEFFKQSNDACTYADQSSCDAAPCSWCKSAAVKSRCYTFDDAKTLPSSIFACDNLSEESDDEEEGEMSKNINAMRGHNGKHGKNHHGKHGHGHGHKLHRVVGPVLLLIAVVAHFLNMRCYIKALEEKEVLKGETQDAVEGCSWGKKKCNKKENKKQQVVAPEQQPVSYAPSSNSIYMPVNQLQ